MKTLYVSDVDGTLYRAGVDHLRPQTAELFSRLLKEGVALTVASGRNLYGVWELAHGCGITLPVIAYNGAAIYDFASGRTLKTFPIPADSAARLCEVFDRVGAPFKACTFVPQEGRCRTIRVNGYQTTMGLDGPVNPQTGLLLDEPVTAAHSREILCGEVLFVGTHGPRSQMQPLYEAAKDLAGVEAVLHCSPYHPDRWFVDIGSDKAGKGTAALFLKEQLGAAELVTFGDNHNDLPMLRMADRSYTVPEAPDEVRASVTGVLDDDPDCVLKFILEDIQR